MQSVELTIETLNLMLGYLSERPWKEVNSIIAAVHSEVGPQVATTKEDDPDPAVGGSD